MKKHYLLFAAIVLLFSSCRQSRILENLNNCEFKLKSVDILEIDKNDVSKIQSINDVDLVTAGKLVLALFTDNAKIKYRINVTIKNPTKKVAGMNQMDIKVFFNNQELSTGGISQTYEIQPGDYTDVPVEMSSDLAKVIKNVDTKTVLSLLFPGSGNSSLFKIHVKPSINIGRKNIKWAKYIVLDYDIFKRE